MKPKFNRLANHYMVLGGGVTLIAITEMFIIRMDPGALTNGSSSRVLLGVSVAFLAAGLACLGLGIKRRLQVTKTVDEAEPLCAGGVGGDPSVQAGVGKQLAYTVERIKRMLDIQRPEILESNDWLDRLLNQLFQEVELSSPVLQAQARVHFARAFSAAISFCLLSLLALSIFLGVFGTPSAAVVSWTAAVYFCCLSAFASRAPSKIVWLVVIAVMLPAIVGAINAIHPLPILPNSIFVFASLSFLLPVLQFGVFFYFLKGRLAAFSPQYGCSQDELDIQHTLNPAALFQSFESIMEHRRVDSLPNRRYLATLTNADANSKTGSFSGEMLWETHAQLQSYAGLETSVVAWGAVALTLAGFIGVIAGIGWEDSSFLWLVVSLLFIRYGYLLLQTAELFTLECIFASRVAWFRVTGTRGRVKISAGNQFSDPFNVQNETDTIDAKVVVSVADFLTSVFAAPGQSLPFRNQPRFVISFIPDQQFLESALNELEQGIHAKINVSQVALPSQTPGKSSIVRRVTGQTGAPQLPSARAAGTTP